MNKVATILLAAAVSTALFAQAATTPADTAAKAKKPAAAAKKAPAAAAISGTVSSVDAIGNTIIVKAGKKEDTLSVDSSTVIKSAGKEAKLADIASGAKVTVNFKTVEGKKVATKITEKPAAPAKK